MNSRIIPVLFSLFVILPGPALAGIFPNNVFSNNAAGTTAAAFLKELPGARFEALGGAGLLLEDPDSVFMNPANLAALGRNFKGTAGLGFEKMLETSYRSSLSLTRSLPGGWTGGAGFLYASQDPMDSYNTAGEKTGSFNTYDMAVSVSGARAFNMVDAGLAVKFIKTKIENESAGSAALDAGIRWMSSIDPVDTLAGLAFTVRNLGFPLKVGSGADPLPLEFSLGTIWHMGRKVNIVIDGRMPVDHVPFVSVGAECLLIKSAGLAGILRFGFNSKNMEELGAAGAVSAGFGVVISGLRLDYAWVPAGDLGTTHRFSLAIFFGK